MALLNSNGNYFTIEVPALMKKELETKDNWQEFVRVAIAEKLNSINMTTNTSKTQWQYLEPRPHPWRQQLYIKGKRIKASVIYSDMIVNDDTPSEALENWDLPLAAIEEVIEYCQSHQELLEQEAAKERRIVLEGVTIEPSITHR